MSMQLRQKEVVLDQGRKIVVCEAGWDYSFRFSEMEKELEPVLADPNHNETFKFFCRNYYSLMASCVVDNVPTPQEAFSLSRMYLDNWYLTVWELNEDIIGLPCPKTIEHEEVKFRDGNSVVVWQSQGLPSFVIKLIELENYATEHPLENDPQGQMFISLFYPKMAASCNGSGDIPSAIDVRNWPRSEIAKWMDASRRLNPNWYTITEKEQEEVAAERKKKVRKR
jgi:hypothetical protein